jgi:hypothetical protein
LYNERNFLWRKSENILNSVGLVIQDYILIFVFDVPVSHFVTKRLKNVHIDCIHVLEAFIDIDPTRSQL